MPVTRLVVLVVLSAVPCAGPALAQAQPDETSTLIEFQSAASMNASVDSGADQFQLSPDPRIAPKQYGAADNPLDRIRVDEYRPTHPYSFDLLPDAESDKTCYYIRNYLVTRDSPHSDSTHRDGYLTCVSAARFRLYVTTDRAR
jgi:hypothetical protein